MSLASIEGVLAGRRALVTGATGFIGGRLAERLVLEHGAEVRRPGAQPRPARPASPGFR